MTTAEIVSTVIALLALVISAITAYRTLFTKFNQWQFLQVRGLQSMLFFYEG